MSNNTYFIRDYTKNNLTTKNLAKYVIERAN